MPEISSRFPERVRDDFITADRCIGLCDHVFWQDNFGHRAPDNSFYGGQSVFCKIDRVWECFGRLVRSRRRIVLVTGQGDYPINDARLRDAPANIQTWFGSNALASDRRVQAIPLGLGAQDSPVTLHAGKIADALTENLPRTHLLYINFRPDTNPEVREPIYRYFETRRGEDWLTFQPPAERGANSGYLDALMTHRFVLCPPGFGIDTHRMWEALYACAIPVVLRSPALRAFENLPILFVDDIREITPERLQAEEQRFLGTTWNLDPLFFSYWKEKILSAREAIQGRPQLSISEWLPTFGHALIRRFSK